MPYFVHPWCRWIGGRLCVIYWHQKGMKTFLQSVAQTRWHQGWFVLKQMPLLHGCVWHFVIGFKIGILEPSCSTHITYHWFSQRLSPEDRDLDVDNNTFRWCLLHGKSPQQFGGHAPSVHMDGRKAERIWDPSCPANLWFEFCISPNGTVSKKRVRTQNL